MKLKHNGLALCFAAALFAGSCLDAQAYYTEPSSSSTYIYNSFGMSVATPDAYEYSRTVDLREVDGYSVTRPTDMCVTDEYLYMLEMQLGVIFRFDAQMNYIDCLKEFTLPDGTKTELSKPEGIFVASNGTIYVADTGNSRVLVSDWKGNVSLVVVRPENIVGTLVANFLPTKVVADSAGRISVIARNINLGIMQFTAEGLFTGYTGAPSVKVDAFTKFLRSFYTDAQRADMVNYVPTEYSNMKIDENNFIWGTIMTLKDEDLNAVVMSADLSGSTTPIKKLNMKGADVLVRRGDYPPIGDLVWTSTPSKIADVGLGPNNIYSMLDTTKCRIFTYNNDGILLYAFGGLGTVKGELRSPVAIDYIGDNIYVLDSALCSVIVYEPTEYGKLLIDAEGYYADGDFDSANQAWKQVTELNSNFAYPYVGLGNAEYEVGNFDNAMEFYEYADDVDSYSNAKERLRKESMSRNFPYIVGALMIFIALFIGKGIFVRVRRYVRGELITYGEDEK